MVRGIEGTEPSSRQKLSTRAVVRIAGFFYRLLISLRVLTPERYCLFALIGFFSTCMATASSCNLLENGLEEIEARVDDWLFANTCYGRTVTPRGSLHTRSTSTTVDGNLGNEL